MRWKDLTKIAVSGSRRFPEKDLVTQYLDDYIRKNFESTEDVVIITGGAIGVDGAVELYCMRRGIKNLVIHARWLELERSAGPHRNVHIINLADEFFGFWDGKSEGTKNAIDLAKKKGIVTKILGPKGLRKALGVKPPVKIIIPNRTRTSDAHKMRELVAAADIKDLFRNVGKKKKKVKI